VDPIPHVVEIDSVDPIPHVVEIDWCLFELGKVGRGRGVDGRVVGSSRSGGSGVEVFGGKTSWRNSIFKRGEQDRGPTIPTPSKVVKQGTEVTKDQVQTSSSQSTTPVQPLVIRSETQTLVFEPAVAPVSVPMPNLKSSIPYPSRRDNERHRDQANEQIEKLYEIFKDMSFEISFTDALILMPKVSSTLKALIGNKEKLS
nr:reverse transcriptase domain-containing protein [Tanacetum cinerariifolium]